MKIAGWSAVAVFLLSAALQWNDPDPWRWIAAYLTAAAISAAACLGKPVRLPAGVAAAIYFTVAIAVAPDDLKDSFKDVVAPQMKTVAIEEARETLGLGLCAAWCAVLAWRRPS